MPASRTIGVISGRAASMTAMIYVFDVASDPATRSSSGRSTPSSPTAAAWSAHTRSSRFPGGCSSPPCSNSKDDGGKTALVEYNNDGKFIETVWMPENAEYGYDVRVQPRLNRMLTSSFTGRTNYMMDLGKLIGDAEAMKHFGNTMVVWDFHARKPIQTLQVPGAPLEIRWALQPRHNYAFTATALTSKIWLIAQQADGTFAATAVGDIGDPKKMPLARRHQPVGRRPLALRRRPSWTARSTSSTSPTRSTRRKPLKEKVGKQANMVSETWDGKRLYFTSSLLANWDKKGADDEQFLKAYRWDGRHLAPLFQRRLPRSQARPPAHHALRAGRLLQEPDLRRRATAHRRPIGTE